MSIIPNIADAIKNPSKLSTLSTHIIGSSFKWPNSVSVIPKEVFGFEAISVPDGFLPPGKSDGNIFVI